MFGNIGDLTGYVKSSEKNLLIRKSTFCKKVTVDKDEKSPFKVQLFWEGHKNLHIRPYGFDIYLLNVKTIRKIAQLFLAFSENLNFIEFKNFSR